MKTRTTTLAAILLLSVNILVAQSPKRFNYQAVVRDASNNPYTSQDVGIRFTILNSSMVSVYTETQSLTTNGIGLVNTVIGDGNPTAFDALEWGSDEFSLKIELDLGDNGSWETSETKSLNSVPYALHAETAGRVIGDSIWKKTGSDIYFNKGNVGLGTNNAVSTLHIKAPAISGTEELFTAEVADDPKSYFRIVNGTMNEDKFMPAIVGMNGADHRQGLFILAKTTESNDIVTSQPLMSFNVRRDDNTPIENRRIFQWGNLDQMKMTMLANGKLGIGTTTPSSKLHVEGDGDWADEDPLFQVKNSDGVPVFAVYNNGVRILVEDDPDAKGRPRGGFSVAGFDRANKGYNQTYDFMRISPDSIRFNINNTAGTKGPRGGFAVGGFDRANKGPINEEFMYITPQSSSNGQYNTFVGYKSGENNIGEYPYSSFNCFFGYESGFENTTGLGNVFLGWSAAHANTIGSSNVFIGANAAVKNSSGNQNVFIGTAAGGNNTVGDKNIMVGYRSGCRSDGSVTMTGGSNIVLGEAFSRNTSGSSNICMGTNAGDGNTTGNNNIMLGFSSGRYNSTGEENIYLGSYAGNQVYGSNNVMIGDHAGNIMGNADYKLAIESNGEVYNKENSLIYGDFLNRALSFNGDVDIDGDVYIDGTFSYSGKSAQISDINLKENLEELTDINEKIESLSAYKFDWNYSALEKYKVEDTRQIGLIAQEVEKVFPELVSENNDGYKTVDYSHFSPILLQAIKEQQSTIESLSNEVEELRQMVSALMEERK